MAKIYAVKKGLVPGIYHSWDECKAQVEGYSGAIYKSFKDVQLSEAINFVGIEQMQVESNVKRFIEPEPLDKRTLKMLDRIDPGFSPAHAMAYTMSTLASAVLKKSDDFKGFEPNQMQDPFAPKAEKEFKDLNHVDIYTDGSYKYGKYSYAFVVVDAMGNVIYQTNGLGTNEEAAKMESVAGELSAAMHAICWAYENGYKCRVHHDNMGVGNWARGSWKAKNKHTKEYVEFTKSYSDTILGFEWVRGHAGNKYNEMADVLAGKAFNMLSA